MVGFGHWAFVTRVAVRGKGAWPFGDRKVKLWKEELGVLEEGCLQCEAKGIV